MPPLAHLFRALVLLVLAAHVFYMYCTARAMGETFGFNLTTTLGAALFALVMLVPLVWAVTIPELPEIYLTHTRPLWRWKRRRCPTCGYSMQGLANEKICPECGDALRPPRGYHVSRHTIRLFIAINLLAWVLGCAVGEGWMLRDEQLFREEFAATSTSGATLYSRPRRWPSGNTHLGHTPGLGFSSIH